MRTTKTEVIEHIKIRCTFDIGHGATSTMYCLESLLDGSILQVGHGNGNEELDEKGMRDYMIQRGVELIRLSRYKDHVNEFQSRLEKAIKIIENVSSGDSVFKEACLLLEEIRKS